MNYSIHIRYINFINHQIPVQVCNMIPSIHWYRICNPLWCFILHDYHFQTYLSCNAINECGIRIRTFYGYHTLVYIIDSESFNNWNSASINSVSINSHSENTCVPDVELQLLHVSFIISTEILSLTLNVNQKS